MKKEIHDYLYLSLSNGAKLPYAHNTHVHSSFS
jgi:hypothetical protein